MNGYLCWVTLTWFDLFGVFENASFGVVSGIGVNELQVTKVDNGRNDRVD